MCSSVDTPGYREIASEGLTERNPLAINRCPDGKVSGYVISHPGKLLQKILQARSGGINSDSLAEALLTPLTSGFLTTLVLEGAHESLAAGKALANGAVEGTPVDLKMLLVKRLGTEVAAQYL